MDGDRDIGISGTGTWLVCVVGAHLLGATGGTSPTGSPQVFDLSFPVARVAATVGVATAALPYLSRWLQRSIEIVIAMLALATVVNGSGLPVAVLVSLAVGWGVTALVHLIFGSPLGLPSPSEVGELLADFNFVVEDLAPVSRQEWGVGRFDGRIDGVEVDVSVYGRDASDAQLLAKTARYLFYRDSGPSLTLTRRQQVEHEAYLMLMAERAGVRVPQVLAAGPAGAARDALLVTRPPVGRLLGSFAPFVLPPSDPEAVKDPTEGSDTPTVDQGSGSPRDVAADTLGESTGEAQSTHQSQAPVPDGATVHDPPSDATAEPVGPIIDDRALEGMFGQLLALRSAGIAHGALSTQTVVVDDDGGVGFVDFRSATTMATADDLNRDMASVLAAASSVAGPVRTVAAATNTMPKHALIDALPFLQRAALDSAAAKSLRGKKAILKAVREEGAAAAGVEVPKLIEPRRISWVTLVLVIGTLIGGWALIGVLINVGKSWSTITGAAWGWVAVTFVLAQAAYPAIAVTTVGSVTDPLPYGRTVALEISDAFVALAGGSMAVLATRVRFFQQEGYTPTIAVSSGVLVSTASWIVKGGIFLIALPLALSNFNFGDPEGASGGGSDSNVVWLIVIVVAVVGVALGLVFAVPRWRRLAAAKLRPKASEVWSHLRILAGHPRNLVEIFGGNIAAQLFVAMALGTSLHAFGQHLSLATLIIVLTLGSMLGGVSPVPGGMGVVEAGMIIGLTAAGISEQDAVAAVFVQRLFTAYLPPVWGWFVLVWMRKKEYL